jgi:predicted dehydrogenase
MSDLNLGVVGVSEGNGHPYSFSAIINGYDDEGFEDSEWGVIHDYLREKDASEFGFPGVEVTHAWTQDETETHVLCRAARIPNAVAELEDLVGSVDAVLIARDDYETHLEMARPFLERGLPTFVDKPLTLDTDELATFRPYLEDGLLMSCSGMRYARELDGPRANRGQYGTVKHVDGVIIKNWAKYGVHLLDAIFGVLDARPERVHAVDADCPSITIETTSGPTVGITTLGTAPITFDVDIYGTEAVTHHQLRDNFRAFRRTLYHFLEMVRSGEPALAPAETLDVLKTTIAGQRSMNTGDPVAIADVEL